MIGSEVVPARREEDGVPRARASRVHPVAEGKVGTGTMPEPGEPMGAAVQLQSEEARHHPKLPPSVGEDDLCRHLRSSAGFDQQPYFIW